MNFGELYARGSSILAARLFDDIYLFSMASVTIQMRLDCTVREDRETGCFVSRCPALSVFSAGQTELEALAAIESAVLLYVKALYRQNRLDEKLLLTGFAPVGDVARVEPGSGQYIALEDADLDLQRVKINVPLLLALQHQNGDLVTA